MPASTSFERMLVETLVKDAIFANANCSSQAAAADVILAIVDRYTSIPVVYIVVEVAVLLCACLTPGRARGAAGPAHAPRASCVSSRPPLRSRPVRYTCYIHRFVFLFSLLDASLLLLFSSIHSC
jgi:hypothetical protein